jgi:hypothetical protein
VLAVPQLLQSSDKGVPQLPQNFLPRSFSVPQLEQIIAPKGHPPLKGRA